ncbi:MAG: S8 family peptidase [Candidatus Thiodiazotropha sp. (ex Rostrolucina anterorostrata)]|nr:S8 family peptidase [Candidatus Thiodiazotropha sp. (ex Rostrolucina anterorostrata)]
MIISEQLSLSDEWSHMHDLIIEVIDAKKIQVADTAKKKSLTGRLFLSITNEQGLNELLSLWQQWEEGKQLPTGKTKWRDVFNQLSKIRRWGVEETLRETGMIERWRDLVEPVATDPADITFQIELFYMKETIARQRNEQAIIDLLKEIGGSALGSFIDMEEIAFHAVKAILPAEQVRHLLEEINSSNNSLNILLFKFPGVMYFRPTGQSITTSSEEEGGTSVFPEGKPELPAVAAILDGVPNLQHLALKARVLFDDPDNLVTEYRPGERRHGTSMASLIVHGELSESNHSPLSSYIYHLAVMQPNPSNRSSEYFPDDVFFEDRIERAVRRLFEGDGNTPAQAPHIKIINISLGDPEHPFIHTPSPWSRLLDWLSFKYRVLFCVSAGNYVDDIDVGISSSEFSALTDDEKINHLIKCVASQLSEGRLLSPAESLNALTVGALHADSSSGHALGQRIDLLPSEQLFSPVSRLGHGFRRSIKPEIFFPGGQQLYKKPYTDSDEVFSPDSSHQAPGKQVAWDSALQGELSKTVHTCGTSNATALATRSGIQIHEVLAALQLQDGEHIPEGLMAVLIKTLLVHGAKHDDQVKDVLVASLKTSSNSRRFKEVISRYLGYGLVNIDRVLACAEQRGTVLGCGEISENEVHEYHFPLPSGLSGQQIWRRMVVTMAWFSPINPSHRNLREAKLSFQPPNNSLLNIGRVDADHNQVLRGTVQHEVLEGDSQISAYQDGDHILLHVTCKADATARLDETIPYGLAVTLEVEEGVDISIYSQIRDRIQLKLPVN